VVTAGQVIRRRCDYHTVKHVCDGHELGTDLHAMWFETASMVGMHVCLWTSSCDLTPS
jgi:hypothetical protein